VGAYEDTDFEEEYRAVFGTLPPSGRALEINTRSPMAVAKAAGFRPGRDRFDFWRR
jgi:histidinol-phosphatase (PHP family)